VLHDFKTHSKVDEEFETKDIEHMKSNTKHIEHKTAKKQDEFKVSLTHAQPLRAVPTGYAATVTWEDSDLFPSSVDSKYLSDKTCEILLRINV
jgi:hypothetical protein